MKGENRTELTAEAMSEMHRQLHATSVCLVRCGMRACEGMILAICTSTLGDGCFRREMILIILIPKGDAIPPHLECRPTIGVREA